jgi:hypothetical protein
MDGNCKPFGFEVGSGDSSFARFNACFHDSQPEAHTPGISIPRSFGAKERFKKLIKEIVGNTATHIPDFNVDPAVSFLGVYNNRAGTCGVFDGISQQVGKRTRQQFRRCDNTDPWFNSDDNPGRR